MIVLDIDRDVPPLSLNHRPHWAERNRQTQEWRELARLACVAQRLWAGVMPDRLPSLTLVVEPPDRRHRDSDNLVPVLKAVKDGVADYLKVDDEHIGWAIRLEPTRGDRRWHYSCEVR